MLAELLPLLGKFLADNVTQIGQVIEAPLQCLGSGSLVGLNANVHLWLGWMWDGVTAELDVRAVALR